MIELRTSVDTHLGLILTPRIDLSLKILAMNITEIEQQLKEIAESNPIVKIEDDIKISKETYKDEKIKEIDESFKEYFHQEESVSDIIEATTSKEESLQESLLSQLTFEIDLDEKDLEIAKEIIYNINEKGFLDTTINEIADKTGSSLERVEFIRKRIIRLEPIGCAALDTKEFIMIQAEEEGIEIDKIKTLIDAMDDVNRPDLEKIKERTGFDKDEFRDILNALKSFLLYPLENYHSPKQTDFIEPDVYVRKINGKLIATLEDKILSKIAIDEEMLNEYIKNSDAKKFIEEKYKEIKEFIIAISQRNKTLLKTVNVILEKQSQFFEDGTIKPLTRKEIAEILGFNVSTITRAVSNKYMLFEGKIIPLSKFFSSGVSEDISKDYVKSIIKEMIDKENKLQPLSDDQIKAKLEKMGIKLTRRTITKYRKELNIPSSRERRCQDTL
ncbi:RNA polymerase factor sigma-54 [Hippea alviniae]|uniref:RNA polymerase factor sigma-54 n=1 Tax=Hippea alviniae TaxID=1279027 RepID=UPI0003B743AD|nr:RNA polymerase factor sigma-54 [Hippea alviniae]